MQAPGVSSGSFGAAAQALQRKAILKFAQGDWTANDVTEIAYYLQQMGARVIPGLPLRPNPDDPYHNCSRQVDRALGLSAKDQVWYRAKIPVFNVAADKRELVEHCFHLPHMAVDCWQPAADPGPLRSAPCFTEHAVTKRFGADSTVPIGIFVDGTDYSQEESLTVWYQSLDSSSDRLCITVLESSQLCRCGCGGACTTLAVDRILHWSLQCAAAGVHPTNRHDGQPFAAASEWQARAGQPMKFHGAFVHIRLDLLATWEYLGFLRWNSNIQPCRVCQCMSRDELFDFKGHQSWIPVGSAKYMNEVASRTIVVTVRVVALCALLAAVTPTWSTYGRELTQDFPELNLCRGDALAVAHDVPDLYFDTAALVALARQRPVKLVFQRWADASCKFASPLLSVTGAGLHTVSFCRMHTFDLGPVSVWNGVVIRRLLRVNAFNTGKSKTGRVRGLAVLSKKLARWKPIGARGPIKTWIKQIRMRNLGPATKPF